MFRPSCRPLFFSSSSSAIALCCEGAAQDSAAPRELLLPALQVEASGQAVDPAATGVVASIGTQQTFLRPAADTFLWKGGKDAQGGGKGLLLRDARFSQGLIQLDLEPLSNQLPIESAKLRFKTTGVERAGKGAKIQCHRMLVDWSEQATWSKPASDAPAWDGLKPGVHYEAEPFAMVSLDVRAKRGRGGGAGV